MNKTLIAALIVSAGLGSQAFAQKIKQGTITLSLTRQYQLSTNLTVSGGEPTKWQAKTKTAKVTQASVLSAIGVVIKHGFSSKAQLVLVDGELSGYFGGSETDSLVQLPEGQNSYPAPGLFQPLGQIFAKDGTYCTNVTAFFRIKVQECYDCFYLNSFVTDSTFQRKASDAPPCCSPAFTASGSGTDKYYVTLSFDNTVNNSMLVRKELVAAAGDVPAHLVEVPIGLDPHDNGITPDDDTGYAAFDTAVCRFSLNGIVTYKWSFKPLASGQDTVFIGTASCPATGYGFIAKTCCLLTGSWSIAEKALDASSCCFTEGEWFEMADVPNEPLRVDWNQDATTTY
jgi:hypothetical protein